MRRILLFCAALFAAILAHQGVRAASEAKFDLAAFTAAQTAGKPILVAVHADWCPMCTQQKTVMGRFIGDAAFKDVVIFSVDYDAQKDVVRRFNVRSQGTLIAFHGTAERDRAVGVTDEAGLRALVAKTAN